MEWSENDKDLAHKQAEAAFVGVAQWDEDVRLDCMNAGVVERLHHVADNLLDLTIGIVHARGGTMTADDLERLRSDLDDGLYWGMNRQAALLNSHSAQGARIAVLEAENDTLKTEMARREEVFNRVNKACRDAENRADAMEALRDREHARANAYDKERDEAATRLESIRRRSLEAGNLERLITEHGLPAAMRAACWEAVQEYLDRSGLSASSPALGEHLKSAIANAKP